MNAIKIIFLLNGVEREGELIKVNKKTIKVRIADYRKERYKHKTITIDSSKVISGI